MKYMSVFGSTLAKIVVPNYRKDARKSHLYMSDSDHRTGTFHQMLITADNIACSVKGLLGTATLMIFSILLCKYSYLDF